MMAFRMRYKAVFIALFHVSILVATMPPCQTCGSAKSSPQAPKVPSPKMSLTPPAGSLNTNKETKDGVFDVTKHGAVADGHTESSSAFSKAWTAACDHPGASTFYIPEGKFLVAPITFEGPCKNDRSPNILIRGTLLAPSSLSAFKTDSWIVFKSLKGLTLTGGTKTAIFDGQGAAEAWKQPSCKQGAVCEKLITSILFVDVLQATISSITLSNGKGFHLGLLGSSNININNVNIVAPSDSPNTDGIHVGQSSNINITSSTIGVGDDCVSIGPGSRNISITKVQCGPGHGISVGSLGKYQNEDDVDGIYVQHCTIKGTTNGVRVKTWPGSPPSSASNMRFEDIYMIDVSNPIIIDQEYGNKKTNQASRVSISNVHFVNINGTTTSKIGVQLLCSASNPCQGIHLSNVNLKYTGPGPKNQPFNSNCTNAKVTYAGFQSPPPCS